MLHYKTGADLAADLKRQAHAVRQAVDARPVAFDDNGKPRNPRKARLVPVTSAHGTSRQLPDLEPQARHAIAIGRPLPSLADEDGKRHWYVRAMRDRNDNGRRRRRAA